MNTTQLECFVTLAKTLNYNQTADELGFTQPAISKQIQSLERELDAVLFTRTTRSVQLTAAGIAFYPEAESMLEIYDRVKSVTWQTVSEHITPLRIGFMDSCIPGKISGALEKVIALFPKAVPDFYRDDIDVNLKKLKNGQLDVVIGMRDARFSDDEVVFEKLKDDRFVCLFNRDHPLAEKLAGTDNAEKYVVSNNDLFEYRQIISIPRYMLRGSFSRGRNLVPVNDRLANAYCSDSGEVYSLLKADFGFALLPEHQCLNEDSIVKCIWKESPSAPFGIYRGKDSSNIVNEFIKSAKEIFC